LSETIEPILELDLGGLKKEINDKIAEEFKTLKEALAPIERLESLDESLGKPAPQKFDYKVGVDKLLHTIRGKIHHDDYKYRNEDKKVTDIAIPTMNESLNETEYTLTEAIGSLDPDCCIPELWADKIERDHVYPGSVFLGASFMNWYDDLQGRPGDKVHICRVGPAVCTDLACDEPTTTAAVVECPYITLEHDTCAYYICREDIEDVQVGLVDALNEGLGSCLAVCVDNYFFNIALSCTNAGTLEHTGAMTGSLILEAMGSMLAGTYKPAKIIMHPVVWTSLMQDTNFTYANRFGSRDVISGGNLQQAYGIDINVTPKGTLEIGGGTYRTLLLAKGALAGAIKHGITLETEYSPRYQKRWVIADIRYGGLCLHPESVPETTLVDKRDILDP